MRRRGHSGRGWIVLSVLLLCASAAAPSLGAEVYASTPGEQPPRSALTYGLASGLQSYDASLDNLLSICSPTASDVLAEPLPVTTILSSGGRSAPPGCIGYGFPPRPEFFEAKYLRARGSFTDFTRSLCAPALTLAAFCAACLVLAAWASLTADPAECYSLAGFACDDPQSSRWIGGGRSVAEDEFFALHASGACVEAFAFPTVAMPLIPPADKPKTARAVA